MGKLTLAPESLDEIDRMDRGLLLLGVFEDERPLRGLNGLVDWRHNGRLSRLIQENTLAGCFGERTLFAAPKKVGAPKILILGLGEMNSFSTADFTEIVRQLLEIIDGIKAPSLALNIPGAHIVSDDLLNRLAILTKALMEGYRGDVTLLVDKKQNFKDLHAKFRLIQDELGRVTSAK